MMPLVLPWLAVLGSIAHDPHDGFLGRLLVAASERPGGPVLLWARVLAVDDAACRTRLAPARSVAGRLPHGEFSVSTCNQIGLDRHRHHGPDQGWGYDRPTHWEKAVAVGELVLCRQRHYRYPTPSAAMNCHIGRHLRRHEERHGAVDVPRLYALAAQLVDPASNPAQRSQALATALGGRLFERELARLAFKRDPYRYRRQALLGQLEEVTRPLSYLRPVSADQDSAVRPNREQSTRRPEEREYDRMTAAHLRLVIERQQPALDDCVAQSLDRLELGYDQHGKRYSHSSYTRYGLILSWQVGTDGGVRALRIEGIVPDDEGETVPPPRLTACLTGALAKARFPPYLWGSRFERFDRVRLERRWRDVPRSVTWQERLLDHLLAGRPGVLRSPPYTSIYQRGMAAALAACLEVRPPLPIELLPERQEIALSLTSGGEVADSSFEPAEFASSPIGACLAAQIGRWRFPPNDQPPQPLRILYPLAASARRRTGLDRLRLALEEQRLADAAQLVQQGVEPDLFAAAALGQEARIDSLLAAHPGRVAARDGQRRTALHWAARSNQVAALTRLLAQGAEVDALTAHEETALDEAARAGALDATRVLLAHRAALQPPTSSRPSTLAWAARSGNRELVATLLPLSVAEPAGRRSPFEMALQGRHEETALYLLAQGVPTTWVDAEGGSALQRAIGGDLTRLVTALLARGADLRWRDSRGNTPLHRAALLGRRHLIGVLHGAGAPLNSVNADGTTALDLAAERGHQAVVTALLAAGAAETPPAHLLRLWAAGDEEGLRRLVAEHPGLLDRRMWDGYTLLMRSVKGGDPAAVERLLRLGADPNTRTWGCALHQAVQVGSLAIVRLLLEHKADVNCVDHRWHTPLEYALRLKNQALVELLQQHGGQR